MLGSEAGDERPSGKNAEMKSVGEKCQKKGEGPDLHSSLILVE